MHVRLPTFVHVSRQDLKLAMIYNKKEKEVFGETALKLIENRIWALDMRNIGSESHTQLSPKKHNLPSLLSSFFDGEREGRLMIPLNLLVQQGSVSSAQC